MKPDRIEAEQFDLWQPRIEQTDFAFLAECGFLPAPNSPRPPDPYLLWDAARPRGAIREIDVLE